MRAIATASFVIQPFEKTYAVTPYVDGTSLVELVSTFESEQGFHPIGGYGGLIPAYFKYGPLDKYFLGDFKPKSCFADRGAYLLGCDCGEVSCWPLTAQIVTRGKSVRWAEFRQEHRPERDYSGFGPFVFEAEQYRQAVADLLVKHSALAEG